MLPEPTMPCERTDEGVGKIGQIPVRNLWLLMFYASNLFRDREKTKVSLEDAPDDIPKLVAELLCHHVKRRIQRNLTHGYIARRAEVNRLRGRVDLITTERRRLLERGKIACRFDDLTVDTHRNRYVRAALQKLSNLVRGEVHLAHRCRSLAHQLGRMGVGGDCPSRSEVSIDRFGRHDIGDQVMIQAAHLAFDLALPTEFIGSRHLTSPEREVKWIRKLYEKGIAGFYEVLLSNEDWSVQSGKTMDWPIERPSAGIGEFLPSMRTDIVLDHSETHRRIVIDTKFNAVLTRGWYREKSLRSGYLYQMYAYLRSQEGGTEPLAERACGMLLHPCVEVEVDGSVVIQNHQIRFATVNLAATAKEIRSRLLQLIDAPSASLSSVTDAAIHQ